MRFQCILFLTFCIFTNLLSQETSQLSDVPQLIEQREYEKAKSILRILYEENDENPQVNFYLGKIALRENNYDDAIDYIDDAIDADDDNPEYYLELGNAYGVKVQNVGAVKAMFAAPKMKKNWEKALELKPDYLEAKINLFTFYLRAPGIAGGDNDEAKMIADEFIKRGDKVGHCFLASYYWLAEENLDKTQDEILKSMNIDSTYTYYNLIINSNAGLLNQMGYHYLNEKDFKNCYSAFAQAIEINPENANAYDSMGDYYVAVAKFDTALFHYKKAVQINPRFAVSRFNKGKMFENLGEKEEAIKVYKKLVNEMPNDRYAEQAQDRLDDLE